MSDGIKFDDGKLRYSLLPQGTVKQVTEVLEFGARKYAPDNWKHVPDARARYYDAAHRHIEAWWSGETRDQETGKHHLAHAVCCLLFLMWLDDGETAQGVPEASQVHPSSALPSKPDLVADTMDHAQLQALGQQQKGGDA